ncbi:MAG: NADAR domain-containing protein [Clostridia bacterium]|nr:NADAR domain-containing protein [Clostridia bacterium]
MNDCKIKIQKIGVTKVDADCVVNAANSALQEGGGVCGAIFKEAGRDNLQKACDVIGGCKTGNAVITPGFRLKAKYIIHAVGPIWSGGSNHEERALYDCYRNSMKLAMENNCHSIAFPLISSGIYGYPKKEAWQVAIRSVSDFQRSNPSYKLDVTFAVLDDDVYVLGQTLLMSTDTKTGKGSPAIFHVLRFHLPDEENGYLSNWYKCNFTVDGKTYNCVEQYMMEQKALIFQDFEMSEKIMQTDDQKTMQDLGRLVKNFVPVIWDGRKQMIVYKGVYEKFKQNPDLLGRLISTGTATPVECSKSDTIWGIGLGMNDPDAADPNKWLGQNLLGFALQAVRTELMRESVH